ncbi:MAG: hypothetical protein H5U40_18140, partial [Polyangiaceae bacterium]|nr:hypothetical protein [Polyangiaceae bacterium]
MSIRIAFVVAMLAMAPALARADDLPCPDPAPIYALRNDEAAIKRLLALPRPRPVRPSDRAEEFITVMRRAWNVRLARVWAPRDRHCHIGVLVAELVEDAVSEDGRGTFLLEERIVPIELAHEPGPP